MKTNTAVQWLLVCRAGLSQSGAKLRRGPHPLSVHCVSILLCFRCHQVQHTVVQNICSAPLLGYFLLHCCLLSCFAFMITYYRCRMSAKLVVFTWLYSPPTDEQQGEHTLAVLVHGVKPKWKCVDYKCWMGYFSFPVNWQESTDTIPAWIYAYMSNIIMKMGWKCSEKHKISTDSCLTLTGLKCNISDFKKIVLLGDYF